MRKRVRLVWSAPAMSDRIAIFDYITSDNPRVAVAVDERIRSQAEHLKRFPEAGRPGRISGTRELVIHRTPYIAAYRVTGGVVRILRVLHGSQRWPDELEEELSQ
jgi:toxin ParE1/3/4